MKSQFLKYITLAMLLILAGCKDFISIDPPVDQITTSNVFSNDETATAAIRGIYAKMVIDVGFASGNQYSVMLTGGLSADELATEASTINFVQFAKNNLLSNNTSLRTNLWQDPYKCIYAANAILENLNLSDGVSKATKDLLTGEAKFIRAFCFFYLTNLFGEVPLILSTDYRLNATAKASSVELIYQQMISDLKDAKVLLSDNYPSTERIRPNKSAASAMLARVYLYHNEWKNAETEATAVITKQTQYKLLDDLNQVFLKNSMEAIWQLSTTLTSLNTYEGNRLILDAPPSPLSGVFLGPSLISNFEPGDLRSSKWVGTFSNSSRTWKFAYKYKIKSGVNPLNEYSMVLRLAEQYLIRAEARIQQDDIENGIRDLNILRKRSRAIATTAIPNPLPDLPNLSKPLALLAVEKERRVELFVEWGHRWLDLKRTHRADAVLGPIKGLDWQNTDVLYPIPANELLNNLNLKQNPSYN